LRVRAQGPRKRAAVASFPAPIDRNPYQALLYRQLAAEGLLAEGASRLSLGWLWRSRNRVAALHFHWPEGYYRHDRGGPFARSALSWLRLGLFGARLAAARVLGYRVVWTVHQVYPHETRSRRLDRHAARVLARVSTALVVHDSGTAAAAARELGVPPDKIHVIPHGSYVGVYPAGRSREEIRAELGIGSDEFVLLSFGQIRKYKDLTLLVASFARAGLDRGVLLIAGLPLDEGEATKLSRETVGTGRVVTVLEFVPDEQVAELYEASDVAVVARSDGGTSGALILALSMGLPVVAAALPAYEELTGHGRAGWHFRAGDAGSLCSALRAAASDPAERAAKGRAALERAAALSWPEAAARTAELLSPRGRST
jgi:glycosyltransferase involved in cell wall biosynthesis